MFWRQLREKYLHSGLVWSVSRHILSDYGDLLCKSPYSAQMRENSHKKKNKNSKHGHFPHSGQDLWFISLSIPLKALHLSYVFHDAI